jgi:DNA replication protein
MQKNDSGMLEEIIDTSSFYEVLMSNLLDVKESKKDDNSLYDIFEKEFGRTLSPIEYEIIGSWVESGIPSELIIEALKEATYNGVNNLRYIDKILFEWNKKGIKKASDISRVEKKEEEEKEESYYEYDWLNE